MRFTAPVLGVGWDHPSGDDSHVYQVFDVGVRYSPPRSTFPFLPILGAQSSVGSRATFQLGLLHHLVQTTTRSI